MLAGTVAIGNLIYHIGGAAWWYISLNSSYGLGTTPEGLLWFLYFTVTRSWRMVIIHSGVGIAALYSVYTLRGAVDE